MNLWTFEFMNLLIYESYEFMNPMNLLIYEFINL